MAVISFLKPKNKLEEGGRAAAPVQSDPGEPEQLCPNCHKSIPVSHLWSRNMVCPCGHHFRMNARQRIAMLTDKGSFRELFREVKSGNPCPFPAMTESWIPPVLPAAKPRQWSAAPRKSAGRNALCFSWTPGL